MANRVTKGFTWSRAGNGGKECPAPEYWPVATGYQGAINGGGNVDINVGDVVQRLGTGYVAIAEGTEIATYPTAKADIPVGVVVAIRPYFDGQVMTPSNFLPGGTAYGTNFDRQSFVGVVPMNAGTWEVDVDENTTATTYAAYLALVGERVDFVNTNGTTGEADPQIDISTHATTVTHRFTIFGLSQSQDSLDFSAANFKLLITANSYADAPNTVGV